MSYPGRSWRKHRTVVLQSPSRRRVLSQKTSGRKQSLVLSSTRLWEPAAAAQINCKNPCTTRLRGISALSMPAAEYDVPIPHHLVSFPPIRDALETESSRVQDETAEDCLALLLECSHPRPSASTAGVYTTPGLQRQKHISFLHGCLGQLPAAFVVADASRPWILYWALTGLHLLGEDVAQYRERYEQSLLRVNIRLWAAV